MIAVRGEAARRNERGSVEATQTQVFFNNWEVIWVICTSICYLASHSNHPYLVPMGSAQLTQRNIASSCCPSLRLFLCSAYFRL